MYVYPSAYAGSYSYGDQLCATRVYTQTLHDQYRLSTRHCQLPTDAHVAGLAEYSSLVPRPHIPSFSTLHVQAEKAGYIDKIAGSIGTRLSMQHIHVRNYLKYPHPHPTGSFTCYTYVHI